MSYVNHTANRVEATRREARRTRVANAAQAAQVARRTNRGPEDDELEYALANVALDCAAGAVWAARYNRGLDEPTRESLKLSLDEMYGYEPNELLSELASADLDKLEQWLVPYTFECEREFECSLD